MSRDMTESRDVLEAELKHREAGFAGLMEGILDQKLDQMLVMLQDFGAAKPTSSRSSISSPSAVYSQPTVRKAQQVTRIFFNSRMSISQSRVAGTCGTGV